MPRCTLDLIYVNVRKRRRLVYEGPVLSIENLSDLNRISSNTRSKYWVVSYEDVKPFFSSTEDEDEDLLVQVSFSVCVKKFSS